MRLTTSIDGLLAEARALWEAEGGDAGRFSADWGCAALLTPAGFRNHQDRDGRLLADWRNHVSIDPSYGQMRFSDKDKQLAKGDVIRAGCLQIPWPALLDGKPAPFDLLVVTEVHKALLGITPIAENQTIQQGWAAVKKTGSVWKNILHYLLCTTGSSERALAVCDRTPSATWAIAGAEPCLPPTISSRG